jgi:hypothetical protein
LYWKERLALLSSIIGNVGLDCCKSLVLDYVLYDDFFQECCFFS